MTERDDLVWKDNDVELFIAGEDAYFEFEINAFSTIYDVLFIWEDAYERKGYNTLPGLSREDARRKPFLGVGYKEHPRNPRLAFFEWEIDGLQSAVSIHGTINEDNDADQGWTVELAIPWKGMDVLARGDGRSLPPEEGDLWHMDFSRFNQEKAEGPTEDSGGWAWSPHGVWDSHIPECFTRIFFSETFLDQR
jgi:hypothetical protein